MAKGTTKRSVAVFNSRQDLIDALQAGLEAEGFSTCGAHVADIQSGALDLLAFVHQHEPQLVERIGGTHQDLRLRAGHAVGVRERAERDPAREHVALRRHQGERLGARV